MYDRYLSNPLSTGRRTPPSRAALPRAAANPIRWPQFAAWSLAAALAYVLVVGLLTAIIPTPFLDRVLAVNAWNLASLVLPAMLFGPLAATYLVPWPSTCRIGTRTGVGAGLSWFAASCPACNKVVVLAVGMSGATGFVRTAQPLIGAVSVLLLSLALRSRIRQRTASGAR